MLNSLYNRLLEEKFIVYLRYQNDITLKTITNYEQQRIYI